MAQKRYYYKILDEAPPKPLPETLPSTPLDAKDGFIHLSTADQVPVTADLYFQDRSRLWLLKLKIDCLEGRIEIDDQARGCPHLHDSKVGLGRANVEEVIEVKKNDSSQKWSSVSTLKELS